MNFQFGMLREEVEVYQVPLLPAPDFAYDYSTWTPWGEHMREPKSFGFDYTNDEGNKVWHRVMGPCAVEWKSTDIYDEGWILTANEQIKREWRGDEDIKYRGVVCYWAKREYLMSRIDNITHPFSDMYVLKQ